MSFVSEVIVNMKLTKIKIVAFTVLLAACDNDRNLKNTIEEPIPATNAPAEKYTGNTGSAAITESNVRNFIAAAFSYYKAPLIIENIELNYDDFLWVLAADGILPADFFLSVDKISKSYDYKGVNYSRQGVAFSDGTGHEARQYDNLTVFGYQLEGKMEYAAIMPDYSRQRYRFDGFSIEKVDFISEPYVKATLWGVYEFEPRKSQDNFQGRLFRFDMVLLDKKTGRYYWYDRYIDEYMVKADDNYITYSGRVYIDTDGYVDVRTLKLFREGAYNMLSIAGGPAKLSGNRSAAYVSTSETGGLIDVSLDLDADGMIDKHVSMVVEQYFDFSQTIQYSSVSSMAPN